MNKKRYWAITTTRFNKTDRRGFIKLRHAFERVGEIVAAGGRGHVEDDDGNIIKEQNK